MAIYIYYMLTTFETVWKTLYQTFIRRSVETGGGGPKPKKKKTPPPHRRRFYASRTHNNYNDVLIYILHVRTRPHYGYGKIHSRCIVMYINEWRRMNNRYCTFDKYLLFNYHFECIYNMRYNNIW